MVTCCHHLNAPVNDTRCPGGAVGGYIQIRIRGTQLPLCFLNCSSNHLKGFFSSDQGWEFQAVTGTLLKHSSQIKRKRQENILF
ncbi:hypothetical protein ATANTOWER_001618 [Ataeniobius toweri]|uniref:Uncharacterized protein n=1 Tax=Ataeniobius toweri TaxID=208326 RepID=A0ABU7C5N6_9TELE|nr:hypothetical protein [Ataeniobius toweri]